MAVTKIQDDWQIQPTTATDNAETRANMAAALAAQEKEEEAAQKEAEGEASPSIYDVLAQTWGMSLNQKGKAIESAAEQMTALDEERKEAEALLAKAKENKSNFFATLLEEQKPVRKEDEEKKLRNRAIIKGLGDLVGAVASGAHAFGKRGMGYVPTLATSSPLKDIEKLNALQDEYLKRKEAWKALDLKIRMGDVDAESAEAQAAYSNAIERMKDAQKAYKDAVKDYDTTVGEYNKDVADAVAEEWKQNRMDRRAEYEQNQANYRASLKGNEEVEVDRLRIYDKLFPYERGTERSSNYDKKGRLIGYTEREGSYNKTEREAQAAVNEYVDEVARLIKEEGMTEDEAIAIVKQAMLNLNVGFANTMRNVIGK